jgi:catechol 2,3-dioxygenase-like lactoylglutathione lyase family enzyme
MNTANLPRLVSLCLDANDPMRLAQFWAEALGWKVASIGDEIGLEPTDGTRFNLLFETVTQQKVGRNRIHLDLTTTSIEDQEQTVARLIEIGAQHLDIGQSPDEDHVVLADPGGNEFCVLAPENSFLAGCGRLGAINCDGTQKTGYFWSEALGWPLVWDQDKETAIRAPDGAGPLITWSGPPLMTKIGKNRYHVDIAPPANADHRVEVERLSSLGAVQVDIGQGDVSWVVMADPDDNEFCVLSPQ